MTKLRTRQPTGKVPWPLILLEGDEKSGKSYAAYSLSADDRIGRTFVLDLGEGTADEYKRLGPYEVIEHNGTYTDMLGQIRAACAVPITAGKPNVVVIDSATALWELLKNWATHRARSSTSARTKLEADPDAEIDVSMNYWNGARDRWYALINTLRHSNVVGVLVCRAREVAKVKNGKPVAGQTEYSVQAEKDTPFAVSAQVRMSKPGFRATLVAIRSLDVDFGPKGIELPDKDPLAHLVFEVMGAGVGSGPAQITHGVIGLTVADAKERLLAMVTREGAVDPKTFALSVWSSKIEGTPDEITPDQMVELLDEAARRLEPSGTPAPGPDQDAVRDAFADTIAARQPKNGAPATAGPGPDAGSGEEPTTSPEPVVHRTKVEVAKAADEAFKEWGEAAPDRRKTKVLKRLRYAVIYAATKRRTASLNGCSPEDLDAVYSRLVAIGTGKVQVEALPLDDSSGITFRTSAREWTYTWAEIEMARPPSEDEPEPAGAPA